MPGSHGEITVVEVEQNRVDNDNNKTRRKKKKKKKEEDDVENENQLETKPRKQFTERFRKKHKSGSGSCKGGCFSVMRPSRTEEEEGSPSSDPNGESFTHDMLRVMLEKSDFFSDECNPHR